MSESGIVYILYLERPLGSEKHQGQFYVGWTANLRWRLWHHFRGTGACFTAAAARAGIRMHLVFTMPGTRLDERKIKNRKDTRGFLAARGIALPVAGIDYLKGVANVDHLQAGDKVIWLRNSRIKGYDGKAQIPAVFVRQTKKRVTIYVETKDYIGNLSVPADRVRDIPAGE